VISFLQCFDTVGWATGRASGRRWFVGGDDLTGAFLRLVAPVVTTTSISIDFNKTG